MIRTAATDVATLRPEPSNSQTEAKRAGLIGGIDGFLKSPFAGIAPFALLSILAAPGRFEVAVSAALGLAVLVLIVSRVRGFKVHVIEYLATAVFAALALVGLLAGDGVIRWLELWSGELVNASLAAFALITLLIGRPFTMAYARETTPREYWDNPLFKRTNNMITGVWASAFAVATGVGLIGDVFFHGGNIWTAWTLQLAAIFFAIAFSEFYPDYASAKFDLAQGERVEVPSLMRMFAWIPTFVTTTGIIALVTHSLDFVVGVAFIVVGSVVSKVVAKKFPAATK